MGRRSIRASTIALTLESTVRSMNRPYRRFAMPASVDRARLAELLARETAASATRNPRSQAAYQRAEHLFGRVPMTWMNKSAGGFPLYLDGARGARVTDLDGHEYARLLPRRHRCDGRALPRGGRRGDRAALPGARRGDRDAADRGRRVGRRRTDPPLRAAALVLLADRDRRQPLGDPAGPRRHRALQDPGQQLLLPRQRGRVADRRRPGRRGREPPRQRRRAAAT